MQVIYIRVCCLAKLLNWGKITNLFLSMSIPDPQNKYEAKTLTLTHPRRRVQRVSGS